MSFKMNGPSLYKSAFPKKTDKQKTTEEKIAEIQATRNNLKKVKGSAYNPNKKENTLITGDLPIINRAKGGGASGGIGDLSKMLKKVITFDYDQDPVNTKK